MRLFHLPLICLLASLGACAAHADARPDDSPAAGTTVTLERSVCFGFCPSYTVTVDADGQVDFTGREHVQTPQAHEQVSPERVAAILAAVEQADFRSLKENYVNQDDGCANMATDMPSARITVADASGSKTVNFYYGCFGGIADTVKPRIDQLAKTIDEQLDTAR